MFLNNTLTKVEMTETDAGMGYKKKAFVETTDIYPVDRQPYSPGLAKKQYGLSEDGIMFRCFTEKAGLKTGDYITCDNAFFIVLLAHDWENHSEIVLGVFKDG